MLTLGRRRILARRLDSETWGAFLCHWNQPIAKRGRYLKGYCGPNPDTVIVSAAIDLVRRHIERRHKG